MYSSSKKTFYTVVETQTSKQFRNRSNRSEWKGKHVRSGKFEHGHTIVHARRTGLKIILLLKKFNKKFAHSLI